MNKPQVNPGSERADESVLRILRRLFWTLESNVEGVIGDDHIDFLHDLRVANRRTRTLLSQIKGVVPAPVGDVFAMESKWLGAVTGPCRDLDVMLLDLDSYRQNPDRDESALGPLQKFLEDQRKVKRDEVCAALQSARFRHLMNEWHRFLDTGIEAGTEAPLASSAINTVAGPRILKAFKRIWKRGRGIGADAPAAVFHRIRIDGKKLRYLLEFFSSLCPGATASRFIKELKRLQDILGDFNDTEIQLAYIGEFVESCTASARALAATSRLSEYTAERQRVLRAEFVDQFAIFASDTNRHLYKKTFKTS